MTETKHRTDVQPSSTGEFLVMGGVSFEFSGLELDLDARTASFCMRRETPEPIHVRCHVRANDGRPSQVDGRQIDVSWDGDACRVETRRTVSILRRTTGGFDVDAAVDAETRPASELLPSLVAAALGDAGGLLLHAAGVELDGRAILFIGPSGAGKTTAVSLTEQGEAFTWDRAAISWDGDTPIAWAMPGGSAESAATGPVSAGGLPLGGIFRVWQAADTSRLEPVSLANGLTLIRESVFASGTDRDAEGATLDAVLKVCGATPTGQVHTVLGQNLSVVLRTALRSAEGVAA